MCCHFGMGLLCLPCEIAVRKQEIPMPLKKKLRMILKKNLSKKTVNELSVRGMSDLVDWMEDDLRERKLEQSEEIESFNELK